MSYIVTESSVDVGKLIKISRSWHWKLLKRQHEMRNKFPNFFLELWWGSCTAHREWYRSQEGRMEKGKIWWRLWLKSRSQSEQLIKSLMDIFGFTLEHPNWYEFPINLQPQKVHIFLPYPRSIQQRRFSAAKSITTSRETLWPNNIFLHKACVLNTFFCYV